MLEDTWHISDGSYPGVNNPLQMWDNYPYSSNQQKKEDNIGLAEAISKSILSTGRIDLQRKLFCSMQLVSSIPNCNFGAILYVNLMSLEKKNCIFKF